MLLKYRLRVEERVKGEDIREKVLTGGKGWNQTVRGLKTTAEG